MSTPSSLHSTRLMSTLQSGFDKISNFDFGLDVTEPKGKDLSAKVPTYILNAMKITFKTVDRIGQEIGGFAGSIASVGGLTRAAIRVAGVVTAAAAATGVGALGFSLAGLAKITMVSAKAIKAASVYTYNKVLKPAAKALNDHVLKPLYKNVLKPVGLAIAAAAMAALNGIVAASVATKNAVVSSSKWLWKNALKPAGEAVVEYTPKVARAVGVVAAVSAAVAVDTTTHVLAGSLGLVQTIVGGALIGIPGPKALCSHSEGLPSTHLEARIKQLNGYRATPVVLRTLGLIE